MTRLSISLSPSLNLSISLSPLLFNISGRCTKHKQFQSSSHSPPQQTQQANPTIHSSPRPGSFLSEPLALPLSLDWPP